MAGRGPAPGALALSARNPQRHRAPADRGRQQQQRPEPQSAAAAAMGTGRSTRSRGAATAGCRKRHDAACRHGRIRISHRRDGFRCSCGQRGRGGEDSSAGDRPDCGITARDTIDLPGDHRISAVGNGCGIVLSPRAHCYLRRHRADGHLDGLGRRRAIVIGCSGRCRRGSPGGTQYHIGRIGPACIIPLPSVPRSQVRRKATRQLPWPCLRLGDSP